MNNVAAAPLAKWTFLPIRGDGGLGTSEKNVRFCQVLDEDLPILRRFEELAGEARGGVA